MQVLQPLQIKSGPNAGKWHMCESNSGGTYPTGHCAGDCPGHDTASGAQAHYDEWCADNASLTPITKDLCHACGKPATQVFTWPGLSPWGYVCEEHANRDGVHAALKRLRSLRGGS
jgi:hypothetical protein